MGALLLSPCGYIVHLMHILHVTPQIVLFCTQWNFGLHAVVKCTPAVYMCHEKIMASQNIARIRKPKVLKI